MHTTNYYNTFIAVAGDCPVNEAEVPPKKFPKTAAQIEYEMLADNPYKYTSDDVTYVANGKRRGISRNEFFSRGQACLRSSPLAKRYGFGIHSDAEGRVALYALESEAYKRFASDVKLKQLKAMRSKRA